MQFPENLELKSYGQQLLAGRQAKGWSQKQLSQKLFLPIHFIRALEAGENGMLPEIPYVISMYRKVAGAVDVDPEPMVQACKDFQEQERQAHTHQPQPRARDVVQTHHTSPPDSQRQSREPPSHRATPTPLHQKSAKKVQGRGKADGVIVLVGCGMGLALVVAALLSNEIRLAIRPRLTTPDNGIEAPATETEVQDESQAAATPAIPDRPPASLEEPLGEPETSELGEPEPGIVRFLFSGNAADERSSWIRVESASGVLLFESTPEPDTSVELPTTAGVRVRAGRPGLVRWQQPGQPPQPLPGNPQDDWIQLIPGPVAEQLPAAPLEADIPGTDPPETAPLDITPLEDGPAAAPGPEPAPEVP